MNLVLNFKYQFYFKMPESIFSTFGRCIHGDKEN